jgi:AraC family transcriptional regulator
MNESSIPVITGRSLASARLPDCEVALVEHGHDLTLARHRHSEAVIGLLVRGTYDESIAGRTVHPGPATVLIKPPETPHANRIGRSGTDTILVQIPAARLSDDWLNLFARPAIYLDTSVMGLTQAMLRELHRADSMATLGLGSLIMELTTIVCRGSRRGRGYSARQSWLQRVREQLHDVTNPQPALEDLATTAGVHRAHLAKAFRAAFGCTVGEYLRSVRLQRFADRLVATEIPIARLAVELGFYDQPHLTRCFRRAFGHTPMRWRRLHRR